MGFGSGRNKKERIVRIQAKKSSALVQEEKRILGRITADLASFAEEKNKLQLINTGLKKENDHLGSIRINNQRTIQELRSNATSILDQLHFLEDQTTKKSNELASVKHNILKARAAAADKKEEMLRHFDDKIRASRNKEADVKAAIVDLQTNEENMWASIKELHKEIVISRDDKGIVQKALADLRAELCLVNDVIKEKQFVLHEMGETMDAQIAEKEKIQSDSANLLNTLKDLSAEITQVVADRKANSLRTQALDEKEKDLKLEARALSVRTAKLVKQERMVKEIKTDI